MQLGGLSHGDRSQQTTTLTKLSKYPASKRHPGIPRRLQYFHIHDKTTWPGQPNCPGQKKLANKNSQQSFFTPKTHSHLMEKTRKVKYVSILKNYSTPPSKCSQTSQKKWILFTFTHISEGWRLKLSKTLFGESMWNKNLVLRQNIDFID